MVKDWITVTTVDEVEGVVAGEEGGVLVGDSSSRSDSSSPRADSWERYRLRMACSGGVRVSLNLDRREWWGTDFQTCDGVDGYAPAEKVLLVLLLGAGLGCCCRGGGGGW